MLFRASKRLQKFKTSKNAKIANYSTIKETERDNGGGPSQIGRWSASSTCISDTMSSWACPHLDTGNLKCNQWAERR